MSRRIRQGIVVLIFIALLAPGAAAAAPAAAKHHDSWLSDWAPRIVLKIQKIIRAIGSNDDINIPPG